MTPVLFLLMLTGVGYVSWLLTRFLVWLDGAEERAEDVLETADGKEVDKVEESRGAA